MKIHQQKSQKPTRMQSRSLGVTQSIAPSSRASMSAGTQGVMNLTEQTLPAAIGGHPFAVIYFWAPLSAPSREFAPGFAARAARNPDILFARVNAAEEQAIVAQLHVRSLPALMIFRSNVVVHAQAGVLTAAALDAALASARALDMDDVRRKAVSVDALALDGHAARAGTGDTQAESDSGLLSIETYLRPSVRKLLADATPRMASGGLLAIRDAFKPEFAERMYRSLDSCRAWRVHEGGEQDFHFRHHNLYDPREYPQDLAWCSSIFESPGTKAWVARLSGRHCAGPAEFSASLYLPGDHSLPHNDVAAIDDDARRQVAFVWHLAKDWRPEWGGALYWCAKASYLPPAFNTLYLFNVGPESNHFVTHVSPYAQGKRLAINGWWTGPAETGSRAWKGPDRIAAGDAEILVY